MKYPTKLFACVFVYLVVPHGSFSQALPNPDFENWTSQGNYEDPEGWNTLNSSTAIFGILTAQKAVGADAYSGNYAIKLQTKFVLGQNANGIATTGTIDITSQTITGGIAYSLRPDSVTGWYKYTSVGGDNGFMDFVLLGVSNDTIGEANFTTPPSNIGTYTYFSAPVIYLSSSAPVLSRCLLSSSAGLTAVPNSTMFIDALQMVFNPNEVHETDVSGPVIEYIRTNSLLRLSGFTETAARLTVSDINGRQLKQWILHPAREEFFLQDLPAGIYLVSVYNNQSSIIVSQKFVKN